MNDHRESLDEIGFDVSISDAGAKAKLKSRFFSALDRLGARWASSKIKPENRETLLKDAVTHAHLKIIEAAGSRIAQDVGADSEMAARALASMMGEAIEQQMWTDEIVQVAIEDLNERPPSDQQLHTGPEVLSDDFVARLKRNIGVATTEEARHRWASVLAEEIRRPGTFSGKAMRIIDETDRDLFPNSRLCQLPLHVCRNRSYVS